MTGMLMQIAGIILLIAGSWLHFNSDLLARDQLDAIRRDNDVLRVTVESFDERNQAQLKLLAATRSYLETARAHK
jgi:hypothetical protein